jgi:hypothetical protein
MSAWFAAAQANQEIRVAIHGLLHETTVANTALGRNLKVQKDLEKAAAVAASCGDLGALSVKVVSARDLRMKDHVLAAFRVCVQLGDRTSYTSVVRGSAQPSWNSEEFMFDVGPSDWLLHLELMDVRNEMSIVHVGKLSVSVAEAMNQHGPLSLRHSFDDTEFGDLEFILQYVSGSTASAEVDRTEMKVAPTPFEFSVHDGFISCGDDLLNRQMTVEEAVRVAPTIPGCKGFTFPGGEIEDTIVEVFFKSKWDIRCVKDSRWTSYKLVTADSLP